MKKILSLSFLAVFTILVSCGSRQSNTDGKVLVSGKVENAPAGVVVLSQFTESRPKVLDTLEVNSKGEFEYEVAVDSPTFYELNLYGQRSVRLALLDENVQVYYDFSKPEEIKIEGSQDSQEMLKLEKLMNDYQAEVNKLNEAYYEAMSSNNSDAIRSIQEQAMELEAQQSEKVKATIESMGDSFASLAAVGLLNPKNDFQFLDNLVSDLNENYPNTKSILQLKQQLDEMRKLSVGQPAPEIELPNPQGEMVKLSDMKGKYVLIDFWAAWCKPCRQENPNLVRMYNLYQDKGFEVFGVSLDRTKEDWLKAIEDDGLTWTHVSDLQYFNSKAAETYQINAIPATYMLDPDGKIIAKDLRGPSLENKLAEIFD